MESEFKTLYEMWKKIREYLRKPMKWLLQDLNGVTKEKATVQFFLH